MDSISDDHWYFAYGSNLDPNRKEARTGGIRESRKVSAIGYRLVFDKLGSDGTGKANLVPDDRCRVWGAVYRCSAETLIQMDRYEGVPGGHYLRTTILVQAESGEELEAVTYVAGEEHKRPFLQPSDDYLERIIRGARHHGLPESYIRKIKGVARGEKG